MHTAVHAHYCSQLDFTRDCVVRWSSCLILNLVVSICLMILDALVSLCCLMPFCFLFSLPTHSLIQFLSRNENDCRLAA